MQVLLYLKISMTLSLCGMLPSADPPDHGDSATVEQEGRGKTPPFSVTRHTPRARANIRLRTHSVDSTEATQHSGKKMRMGSGEMVKSKKKGGQAMKSRQTMAS